MNQIRTSLEALPGLVETQVGRKRIITQGDLALFLELCEREDLAGKSIRVYSSDGFVANSYKWRARIHYLHREVSESGEVSYHFGSTDAHRSRGAGALVTVNGKAFNPDACHN